MNVVISRKKFSCIIFDKKNDKKQNERKSWELYSVYMLHGQLSYGASFTNEFLMFSLRLSCLTNALKLKEEPGIWPTLVLIFCVEFRELSHLTRDLSQAEKKITVVTSCKFKFTTLTILSEIDVILCICSACNNIYFLLSLR